MILDTKNYADRAIHVLLSAAAAAQTQVDGLDPNVMTMLKVLDTLLCSETLVEVLRQGALLVENSDPSARADDEGLPPHYGAATSQPLAGSSSAAGATQSSPSSPTLQFKPNSTTDGSSTGQNYSPPATPPPPPRVTNAANLRSSRKWFIVTVGTGTGVFQGLEAATARVIGISGAVWRGCKSKEEAEIAYRLAVDRNEVRVVV